MMLKGEGSTALERLARRRRDRRLVDPRTGAKNFGVMFGSRRGQAIYNKRRSSKTS